MARISYWTRSEGANTPKTTEWENFDMSMFREEKNLENVLTNGRQTMKKTNKKKNKRFRHFVSSSG